jgi:RimJ/RimL family protein N-acetyltransferase
MKGITVALVPLSIEHVDGLLKHASDPTLWTWWLRKPPIDMETMLSEVESALIQQKNGLRIPFSILHLGRNEYIGSTSLLHPDTTHHSVEIGATWLGAAFHGTGINQECKSLLLAYSFLELGMNRVALQTDELNGRSRAAIEKLGAKLDGILRDDKIVWNGRLRSSAIYSILRSEWMPNQPPQSTASTGSAANFASPTRHD